MPPMQDSPRSVFSPKSQAGLWRFAPPPVPSYSEELPTTPLPATIIQIDQKDTVLLPTPPVLAPQASQPGAVRQLSSARITRQLSYPGVNRQLSSARITKQLSQSGVSLAGTEGAAARGQVIIKGDMKKREIIPSAPHVHRKRRLMVTMSGVLILMLITVLALLTASPLGHDVGLNLGHLTIGNTGQIASSNGNVLSLVAQATATAMSHQQSDGYDPFSNGRVTISDGSGSLNWPVGQCTYWANYRYHELSHYWVSWTGNAAQWVEGARAAGWSVSQAPHVPSILVLMPYTQGAWGYGHVAIVESINDSVSPVRVHTSNMNWWMNGGGWNTESSADFIVGAGVYFVWHR
ncbi:MAG TPA: CHAP domain-containing protein [Ktedonobacteraceae bacterium]